MTNLMSDRARRMRRDKGDAEQRLWGKLRELNRRGFHFRQQAPIGPYIADFCDHRARLVIEVDGSQHGERAGLIADRRRTRWLEAQGYKVVRFWNHEVLTNLPAVEIGIHLALGVLKEDEARSIVPFPLVGEGQGGGDCRTSAVGVPPTPNPSPQGGGGSARDSRNALIATGSRVHLQDRRRRATGSHHA